MNIFVFIFLLIAFFGIINKDTLRESKIAGAIFKYFVFLTYTAMYCFMFIVFLSVFLSQIGFIKIFQVGFILAIIASAITVFKKYK